MSLLLASIAQSPVMLTSGSAVAFDYFAPVTATIEFDTDGIIFGLTDGDPRWYETAPVTSIGDNFEVRASMVSGPSVSGTLNTWLPLTSARTFELTQSFEGKRVSVVRFEIRYNSGATMATNTYTMSAEVYSNA